MRKQSKYVPPWHHLNWRMWVGPRNLRDIDGSVDETLRKGHTSHADTSLKAGTTSSIVFSEDESVNLDVDT